MLALKTLAVFDESSIASCKDDSSHEFDACSQTHLFDDLYSSRVLMLALKTLVVFDEIRRRV